MISNKRHFAYNLLSSYANTIIASVLSFVSVPIALKYWGNEVYGIWTILTTFSTYIMASGLGIDVSTALLMTKNSSMNIKVSILKKGIRLLICCSIFAICVVTLLTFAFPDWYKIIGKMNESNYPIARISALIFITGIIVNLPLSAIANSLQSFGKAYVGTLITTLQSVLAFCSILLTVALKLSLPFYIFIISSNTIFCSLLKSIIVVITIHKTPKDSVEVQEISNDNHYKTILKMGFNMSLYGFALLIIPNISNLIISNNIDVASLVPYSLSYKLFSLVTSFVSSTNGALSPLLGAEYGKNNWEWLKTTYKKMFTVSVSLGVFVILGVIWLSKPFILLWTGNIDNYAGNVISILLGLYFFVIILSNINHVIINSFNYTNKVWLISWLDGVIFLLTSMFFVKKFGVVSVPSGLCFGAYLVSAWAYPMLIYKRSEKRFIYDFRHLFKNLMVFVISVLIFLLIANLNLSFAMTTILDFIGIIITAISIFLILPNEIRHDLFIKFRRNK